MNEIRPIAWQEIFANNYLRDRPRTALLTAKPGEDKTTAALMVWEQLWQEYRFENLIVITPSVGLKEHWMEMVKHLPTRPAVHPANEPG
jgi:hypothetical protein